MKRMLMAAMVLALLASGCAKRANEIIGINTNHLKYSNLTCEQIQVKMETTNSELVALSDTQNDIALADEIAMTAGLFLFWPALVINLATPDHKDEIARLKGEQEALEMASMVNCQKIAER